MTGLWEEFYALDTFVVATPSMQPFLWNVAGMLATTQVARRLHEALACLIEDSAITVINRSWLEQCIASWIVEFGLCKPLFPLLFIGLHD